MQSLTFDLNRNGIQVAKKAKHSKASDRSSGDQHTLPGPVPAAALPKAVVPQPEHEAQDVRRYFELEAPDEAIVHLEKVKSETIFDSRMDVWDVHTDQGRWWVITNPTNLYSQDHFPSLDYTLSFHVGLMMRVNMRQQAESDDQRKGITEACRRVDQAQEALELADEAEEFQAVGMQCREALVAFVRAVQDQSMVPPDGESPKTADFIQWSGLIANTIASGSNAAAVRTYLKSSAKSVWQLVGWLTHAQNAVRRDADLAVKATSTVLEAYTQVLIRHESGTPERCPNCSSYRIRSFYRPDLGVDPPYLKNCRKCGWSDPAYPVNLS